jgi:hypothetical protein
MATTQFLMTMDGQSTSFPQDGLAGNESQNSAGQNTSRYANAGLELAKLQFPKNADSFNTPFVKFTFLDAYGGFIRNSPVVNIRMPSVFNISNFSDYSRTEQIVGGGGGIDTLFNYGKSGIQGLSTTGEETVINMAEAINYSLQKGVGAALGFIQSAGLSGINQFEFSRRQAVNPMAQLLYKGPQYRKYQIPIPMKPRSRAEAIQAQQIIKAFRIASSPSYSSSNEKIPDNPADRTVASALTETSFTFGYPHLVSFDILFFDTATADANPESNQGITKKLYRSKACVIEAVTVDYGGQKIAFFEDGVPSEMNLTLQLTETSARTLGDELTSARQAGATIF